MFIQNIFHLRCALIRVRFWLLNFGLFSQKVKNTGLIRWNTVLHEEHEDRGASCNILVTTSSFITPYLHVLLHQSKRCRLIGNQCTP